MKEKDLKETGLADMAFKVEKDHEVQMARADLYKISKYGIKLHEMLKSRSEEQGLEGWVQAKITKAADYLSSVYHHLDYETKFDEVTESNKSIEEGKGKLKKGHPNYKKQAAAIAISKKANESTMGEAESPMVSFTVPNVTSDMASKLDKLAKQNGVEISRQGRTVTLTGPRIDMTTIRTKMGLAQTNIPMVPVEPQLGTLGNPIGMSKDQMADPANQELMKKARRMDALGDSVEYKNYLKSKLAESLPKLCESCGKERLTETEMKELAELEEGKKHGNSKIYDKCWKGCRKVAGKKRGEPGSCKCD